MKKTRLNPCFYTLVALAFLTFSSMHCKAQSKMFLEMDPTKVNDVKVELQGNGIWQLETERADPWLLLIPLVEIYLTTKDVVR